MISTDFHKLIELIIDGVINLHAVWLGLLNFLNIVHP